MTGYYSAKSTGSIVEQLSTAHKQNILNNRLYMKKLIDIILLLSRQGIAFRGHIENTNSLNKGNFQEMCSFFSKYDSEFNRMFSNSISYSSPKIQNEIIAICSQNVKDTIFSEIKETGFFSIMCDDARCHKEEQMSICVRYTKKFQVFERFLGFIDVSQKQDSESLTSAILNFLEQSNIQNIPIVAQSYDGAAVMSGKRAGVQTKLKEYYPSAIYVHCMAHRINLVVIDMSLYVHFSRPSTNFKLKEMQNKLNIKATTLMAISDTRWVCRIQNCDAVYNNFEVLIEVLNDEVDLNKDMDVAQAIGLLSSIQKASFIIYLIILQDVLKVINILSNQLQKKTSTLGEASNIIFGVIQTFENYRSSNKFSEIWSKITNFAEKHNIPIETPSRGSNSKRKRKESTYLRDYCTSTTTGHEYSEFDEPSLNISDQENWKINAYYRILDAIITSMKTRFSSESLRLASSVDSFFKLQFKESLPFIQNYEKLLDINIESLEAEMTVIKNSIQNSDFTLSDVLQKIDQNVFSNLYKLMQVALTLPISSASCERSFSVMRRIKTWIRSSMNQERFTDMSILHIERDISNVIESENILNQFALKNRRIDL
ncbi:unnamed protein product [Macrosiphum euphorbiae]|uniref:Zinc finger MYM-type protein 1-like n=1 Tax=Macrosiphum euphorbiae TaxID=13131 RepID=A0AAV0WF76_9HEMI|nr:unnamed protein product [Macrosiphum euphorbiae]